MLVHDPGLVQIKIHEKVIEAVYARYLLGIRNRDPGASLYVAFENADFSFAYCGTCRGMKLVSAYSELR
jgi:hypothetical protein